MFWYASFLRTQTQPSFLLFSTDVLTSVRSCWLAAASIAICNYTAVIKLLIRTGHQIAGWWVMQLVRWRLVSDWRKGLVTDLNQIFWSSRRSWFAFDNRRRRRRRRLRQKGWMFKRYKNINDENADRLGPHQQQKGRRVVVVGKFGVGRQTLYDRWVELSFLLFFFSSHKKVKVLFCVLLM